MDVEGAGRLTPFKPETPKSAEKARFRAWFGLLPSLNSAELAKLAAYITAETLCEVNLSLAVFHADCRATDLHAHFAGFALILVNLERRIMFDCFKKCAGSS